MWPRLSVSKVVASMKIYLAGPSAEFKTVEDDADRIIARGHEITYPWWLEVRRQIHAGWASDASLPDTVAIKAAARDMEGVLRADAVIVRARADGTLSLGTAIEFGGALFACDKALVLIGCRSTSIFTRPVLNVDDVDAALDYLEARTRTSVEAESLLTIERTVVGYARAVALGAEEDAAFLRELCARAGPTYRGVLEALYYEKLRRFRGGA